MNQVPIVNGTVRVRVTLTQVPFVNGTVRVTLTLTQVPFVNGTVCRNISYAESQVRVSLGPLARSLTSQHATACSVITWGGKVWTTSLVRMGCDGIIKLESHEARMYY